MDSQRQIRYGELIRSLLSDCLLKEDFFDENINTSSITISFVKMSKDLKVANVYFMPLGGKEKSKILEALKDRKYIFHCHLFLLFMWAHRDSNPEPTDYESAALTN